jgi:hypothetical protein
VVELQLPADQLDHLAADAAAGKLPPGQDVVAPVLPWPRAALRARPPSITPRGDTSRKNIGPGCKEHHWFKHQLGWQLSQPEPGVFVWVSPLEQVYRTRGEPDDDEPPF